MIPPLELLLELGDEVMLLLDREDSLIGICCLTLAGLTFGALVALNKFAGGVFGTVEADRHLSFRRSTVPSTVE